MSEEQKRILYRAKEHILGKLDIIEFLIDEYGEEGVKICVSWKQESREDEETLVWKWEISLQRPSEES